VPRNEEGENKSESDQQIRSIEEMNVVKENEPLAALSSDEVQSFGIISREGQALSEKDEKTAQSTNVPKARETFLAEGQKSVHRFRKSHPTQRPAVCFEFSPRNPTDPPTKICEPITVARQAPSDINIVRYNPYVGTHHSATPLVVLPPYHTSQIDPAKALVRPPQPSPGYGAQTKPLFYPVPTAQLPSSPPHSLISDISPVNTTFPSFWLPDYGHHSLGAEYTFPSTDNIGTSQLPTSVPPFPLSDIFPAEVMFSSPWASGSGLQPAENRYMSTPNQYMTPLQLPTRQINPVMTVLPPSWAPSSGFQPVGTSYSFPPTQYKTSKQFTANLLPPFASQTIPDRTMLPPALPPGYGFQDIENRYISPSYYQFPSTQPRWPPSQMYYIHPSPPAYPVSYTPYHFHAHGNTNILQPPNSKTPVNASPSKSGLLKTIKEQEEAHKVPTPLEDTEKSQGLLNSRSASTYSYIVPQQFSIIPYISDMAYKGHSAESYAPVPERVYPSYENSASNAMHFTPGQGPSHSSATAHTGKSGPSNPPAALTCRVHNPEEKESQHILADDSIAILQLFLKPNPTRHNKYRESVKDITGSSNSRDSLKRPMVQYVGTTDTSIQPEEPSDFRGTMAELKEDWISSQGMKSIYEDKRNIEGMKWQDQEKRALQKHLEQEILHRGGVNFPVLQTVQPLAWYQGGLSPQVLIHPESFNVNGYNGRHFPYQRKFPIQWWGLPQTQFWIPQYPQITQFRLGQQSPTNRELSQESLPGFIDVPSSRPVQVKGFYALEKQNRLNTVKAKLLQGYQSEAAEKRQRARQMNLSDLPESTNSSSDSVTLQLNDRFPSMETRKASDAIQTNLEKSVSKESSIIDVSRNNIVIASTTKPTRSAMNAGLRISRPTSNEAKNLQSQTEMPVNIEQTPEKKAEKGLYSALDTELEASGSIPIDETLDIGTVSHEMELHEKISHAEDGGSYGVAGRSSNQRTPSSDIRRNSEIAIKNNSADVPRVNATSDEEFDGRIQPAFKETETTVSTSEKRKPAMKSAESGDMVTETPVKFKSESDVSTQENTTDVIYLMSTPESEYSNEGKSEAQNNQTDSLATEMKDIVFTDTKNSMNDIVGEKKPTPGEVLVLNVSSDSTLNERKMHNDSKKIGFSDGTEHTEIYESDIINSNVSSNSVLEVTEKKLDLVPVKNNPPVSGEYVMKNDEVARSSAEEMSRSDISTHSADANIFHGGKESNTEVQVAVKSSSERLFTSKPAASVAAEILDQQRDMSPDHVNVTQLTSDSDTINSAATAYPEENGLRSVKWHYSDLPNRSENIPLNSPASSREVSTASESVDVNSNDSQNYKENSSSYSGNNKELQIPFDSNNSTYTYNASSADLRKSKDIMYDQSNNTVPEIPVEKAEIGTQRKPTIRIETKASNDSIAEETSNGTSEMSENISIISSDSATSETEKNVKVSSSIDDFKIRYRMSEAEEPPRTSDIAPAEVPNASTSITHTNLIKDYTSISNENQTELLGMGQYQKNRSNFTYHQMNSEGGFPQTPENEIKAGFLRDGSARNIKMNQTSLHLQDKSFPSRGQARLPYQHPHFPLEPMGYLVYSNGLLPTHHYKGSERDPAQLPSMLPYSYMYPIPLAPAYSHTNNPHSYSNNHLRNTHDNEMVTNRMNKHAETNINGNKIEGNLPFIVVLEQQ
jgi:hypothetical protein